MTTFDGLKYNFQGYCTYVLVKNCDSQGKFEITADVRGRREPTKPPTRMVAINISAIGIPTIRLLEDNSFMIGGKLHRGSNFHSELASVISSRDNVIARLSKPKLSVIWNGKPHKVQVVLNGRELAGTVCGLLGNADGDTTNDFIKPDGDPASSAEEFGNSWAVKNSCP
ncbi:BMP-binding endothelial regulator protein-like [Saccoglossus kowalevskii]